MTHCARIHELAAAHAGLVSRRNDASDFVETTKRRLADATQELEALGTVGDPAVLASVIESTGNPESEMETLLSTRQNCQSLRQRCESMLPRLEGFEGDLEQAVSLALPSDSSVRSLTEKLRSSLHGVTQQEALLKQLEQDRNAIHLQLVEAQRARQLPTLSELQSVRDQRDQITDRLAEAIRSEQVLISDLELLREPIREADRLADTMREHSEQVHRRETLASQIQVLDAKIEAGQQALASAHAEFESAKSDWVSAWRSCQIAAGQPEQMQQWLVNHGKLCDLMSQLEVEEKRLELVQSRIHRATVRLGHVLESVHAKRAVNVTASFQAGLFDDVCEEDLLSRYDEAVALRSQWTRERQQYELVRRRRDDLTEEMPQAETRFEAAQKALEDWHKDWRHLTDAFVKSDRVGTAEVLQMLDQIRQLNSLKRERDGIVAKLKELDEEDRVYAAEVERLAQVIDHDPCDRHTPIAIAHAMYQRLQAERVAKREREALQEQVESSQQRCLTVAAQRSESEVLLRQFCAEAGCQSPSDLPGIERRSRERAQLQVTLQNLTSELMRLAGDQPLEEFVAAVAEQQPAELAIDIEREEARQGELRRQIESVNREIGAVQNDLNRIDGSSRASDLAQSMQMMVGGIRSDVENYARLKVGAMILQRAIEHYRSENQSPVLILANQYFRQLTCGEYVELTPDFDASGSSTLFGINGSGERVPVSGMSTGTADALYLALRLASLQHQMKDGKAIPVVIDDCLIQLDDSRAAAALKAFSELSEKTQVILFTHHQHLCQLAEQNLSSNEYHFHQIGM